MTVRSQQILGKLDQIDRLTKQVRSILSSPEGVRITAVWRDGLSYVEYWDGDMTPRILCLVERKIDEEFIHQPLFEAVSSIPPSYCGSKPIEMFTDIETLSEGINVAINVFEIEVSDIDEELLSKIQERHDFNNYLSQVREVQATTDTGSELCRD